jgi:spore coat polysaccharide biosynthesis protein SpsF
MSVVALVQARTTSTRLPNKVLLPLGETRVIDHVVRRAAGFSQQVVVCTSTDASDDPVEAHCREVGTLCLRGPLENVFLRYRKALLDERVAATEWFARVTADCPFLSVPLAKRLAGAAAETDLDYLSYDLGQLPLGLAVELVRSATFLSIDPDTLDAPEREHVTLALYEQPGRYRVRRLDVPEPMRHPELRLTLDYAEDYELLQRLVDLGVDSAEAAVARLLADDQLARINRHCQQKRARPTSGE